MVLSVLGTLLPEYKMNILKVQVALGTWSHIWGDRMSSGLTRNISIFIFIPRRREQNMRKYEEIHTKKIFR